MNKERIEKIKRCLKEALTVHELHIVDQSHKHAGHVGAKDGMGHFDLFIRASEFEGKTMLIRHRMIYNILHELMKTDIHALSIQADDTNE